VYLLKQYRFSGVPCQFKQGNLHPIDRYPLQNIGVSYTGSTVDSGRRPARTIRRRAARKRIAGGQDACGQVGVLRGIIFPM